MGFEIFFQGLGGVTSPIQITQHCVGFSPIFNDPFRFLIAVRMQYIEFIGCQKLFENIFVPGENVTHHTVRLVRYGTRCACVITTRVIKKTTTPRYIFE